jgi:hypothetical protein
MDRVEHSRPQNSLRGKPKVIRSGLKPCVRFLLCLCFF